MNIKRYKQLISLYKEEFPTGKYTWNIKRNKENGIDEVLIIVSNSETNKKVLSIIGGKDTNNGSMYLNASFFDGNI